MLHGNMIVNVVIHVTNTNHTHNDRTHADATALTPAPLVHQLLSCTSSSRASGWSTALRARASAIHQRVERYDRWTTCMCGERVRWLSAVHLRGGHRCAIRVSLAARHSPLRLHGRAFVRSAFTYSFIHPSLTDLYAQIFFL